MESLLGPDAAGILLFSFCVAVAGGVVKGVVGFAMPMILISGMSSVVPPEIALAGLILPTLVTNSWQALRQGAGAAFHSLMKYRRFLLSGLVFMIGSAAS